MGKKIKFLIILFLIIVIFVGCKNLKKNISSTNNEELRPIIVNNRVLVSVDDGYSGSKISNMISAIDANSKVKKFAYLITQSEDAPDKRHSYPDVDIAHKIYVNYKKTPVVNVDSLDLGSLKFFPNLNSFAFINSNGISIVNKKNEKQVFKSKNVRLFSWNPNNNNELAIILDEGGNVNQTDYIFSLLILNLSNNKKTYLVKRLLHYIDKVVFAPAGSNLFYTIDYSLPGAKDRYELREINIKNKSSKLLISRMEEPFFALSMSPNGNWLAFENTKGNIQLMNVKSKKIYTFKKVNFDSSATTSWLSNNELLVNNYNNIDKIKFKFIRINH